VTIPREERRARESYPFEARFGITGLDLAPLNAEIAVSRREHQMTKQLLHLVFGGQLKHPDGSEFVNTEDLHIVGIFADYKSAHRAWQGAARATVDDAHTRYYIVHLHRLMDPSLPETAAADSTPESDH